MLELACASFSHRDTATASNGASCHTQGPGNGWALKPKDHALTGFGHS